MKNLKNLVLTTLLLTFVSGCAGIKHADKAPLMFSEIDYGFETHYMKGDPGIAYIDEGEGEHTILLVHGLASNAGFWRYNIGELSENNRVIAIDLPGYGKSDKGDYAYGMGFYADIIADFIDTMNLENVIYVGHSMGGQIGITLAIDHPETIDKLVLAAPAGIEKFDPGDGRWLGNALNMRGIVKATEPMVRQNLSINFYRWDSKWEWMVEERVRMAKDPEMREFAYTVLASINAMLNEPTTDYLSLIPHETLIIYGKEDGMIPNRYLNPGYTADVFQKGAEAIPNASLKALDKTGHMLQIENPEGFNESVLQFVK